MRASGAPRPRGSTDAATLASIVRNDSDEAARDHAAGRLVALADHGEERIALDAVAALATLGRQRELAATARLAGLPSIRRAAVEQVTDAKALGGIARHAHEPTARLVAVERLTDPAELEAVATRGEHADAAVEALERLPNPSDDLLHGLVQRARAKAVQKRARALLRAREEAARPAVAAPAIEFKEADQQRARELADQMEAIAATPDITAVRQTYAALRVAWVELLADAEVQPEHVARFEALSDRGPGSAERARSGPPSGGARGRGAPARAGRPRRALSGSRGAQRRRSAGPAGEHARNLGRHAADARGVGGGVAAAVRRRVPQRRAPARAPAGGTATGRLPARGPDPGRGRGGRRGLQRRAQRSGTRCASSGRPSAGKPRSTRPWAPATSRRRSSSRSGSRSIARAAPARSRTTSSACALPSRISRPEPPPRTSRCATPSASSRTPSWSWGRWDRCPPARTATI